MSLAESLNWEQEEQCTSVFPRSVTSRKNQENLKLSEKKELLKKSQIFLQRKKGLPQLIVGFEGKNRKIRWHFMTRAVIYCRCVQKRSARRMRL